MQNIKEITELNGVNGSVGVSLMVRNDFENTGTSKVGSVVETGNATISWPASSGLNPTNAKITIRQSVTGGTISLSGNATSGAFASSVISTNLQPYANTGTGTKAHPLTSQSVINTLPLTAKVNFG